MHDSAPYFIRTEFAYRKRFNNPFDEVRFALWAGIDIGHNLEILVQDNVTWNIQKDGVNHLNNTSSKFKIDKDANNILTLSLLYHYNKHTAFQLEYINRIHGNNPFYDNSGLTLGI